MIKYTNCIEFVATWGATVEEILNESPCFSTVELLNNDEVFYEAVAAVGRHKWAEYRNSVKEAKEAAWLAHWEVEQANLRLAQEMREEAMCRETRWHMNQHAKIGQAKRFVSLMR